MKAQILVRARDDADREDLRAWLCGEFAATGKAASIFVPDVPDPFGNTAPPPFDALIETEAAMAMRVLGEPSLAARAWRSCLTVEPVVQKSALERRAGAITPGAALISLWVARAGVPESEIARHWAEHAPLALEIHHGTLRYVQNHVRARSEGCKPYRGVAVLHFASAEGIPSGLFNGPEDVARIEADVADFVGEFENFVAREHVCRLLPEDAA